MKVAILGAGISGLSMGQLLNGRHDVVIYEAQPKVGGLVKCDRINDCLFHQIGGHVFNSKNNAVLDWFWSFFNREQEFVSVKRKARILFDNAVIGYPIEDHLYQLNPQLVKQIIAELAKIQRKPVMSPFEYPNFESFLQENFGPTLYRIYFEPYNQKIWQTDLSGVAMEWLEGKLPMPDFEKIIYNNIVRREEKEMVHSTFFYPKVDGSQFIVDRLANGLDIHVNSDTQEVELKEGYIALAGQKFDSLIYTGDIRKLPLALKQLLTDNGINWAKVLALQANGTSNLFCETDDTDTSWLYIPQNFTGAHRIIYTGNFSETNNRGSKRKTCVVEFSGYVAYDEMVSEIKKLPGNLTPLASNYQPNSYVIQDHNTRELIKQIKDVLSRYHIYLTGRFAEWEYYNMDKAIESAMQLNETIN